MRPDGLGVADVTATIAQRVADIANAGLGPDDAEIVRRLLLDNFIVSSWGLTRSAVKQLSSWTRRFAGTGRSRVLGSPWTADPATAALVHGMAGHAYELDDTHDVTTSHPGCVVIAAALAVGTETDASQDELFRAIVAGYEAMILIGTSSGGLETVHRGFHPTAIYGIFGAATAALSLRAFETEAPVEPGALVAAWGHCLSQASGSMQFSVEPGGGEVKRLHAGLAARNGIQAAELSSLADLTAPAGVVEGEYGVASSFGRGHPTPARDDASGLAIRSISFKPYSCCRLFHSTIDALREATGDFTAPLDDIEDIVVSGPRLIGEQHMTDAASTMTAQYSCPYIVAATLAYGPTRYDAYGEGFLDDPTIRALAAKVRFEHDPELEATYFPEHFATRVRMTFRDGSVVESMVADSVGTLARPMSVEQLIAKGHGLAHASELVSGEALRELIWTGSAGARVLAEGWMAPLNTQAVSI